MAEVKSNGNDSLINTNEFETSLREVEALSDEDLYDKLKASGKTVGPVVGTTRRLYQKQLAVILSSPLAAPASPVANGTNGTAEANGEEGSDSDDGSFETSSRASRSSRSSSLAKKSKTSLRATPKTSTETFEDAAETPPKRERFTSFATPARSPRTFEEYVAESEARKAKTSGTSANQESAAKENGERATGFLGSLKLLLVIAVFAAIAAYGFILYRNAKMDPDAAIDQEIEALRQKFLTGTPAPQ